MSETTAKIQRHRHILDLVERRSLGSQEELGRALASRGHEVTQSTLSRDLRELGIVRAPSAEGYRYVSAEQGESWPGAAGPRAGAALAREVRSVESNESAVVVHTRVGRAQGVAVEIDRLALDRVLATVAGDDTILVIPRTTRSTKKLRHQLAALFGAD